MNPGGTQDKNLVSLYGADSGTPDNPRVFNYGVLDASDESYTGALKVTGMAHDIIINVNRIIGGRETHYDFNNGAKRITLNCGVFENRRSEYIGSVKGGCEDCRASGRVEGPLPSKGVHHIDGNWSDQSSAITRGTQLGLTPADGSTVLYQQLNSAGVTAILPAQLRRTLFIPFGRLGIAVVWAVWGLLKKLKLA